MDPWIDKGIHETKDFHFQVERECPETDQCFPRARGLREMSILLRDTPDATREWISLVKEKPESIHSILPTFYFLLLIDIV